MNDSSASQMKYASQWSLLGLLIFSGLVAVGCMAMRNKGEIVPESVVACRELSRQGVSAMEQGASQEACTYLVEAVETSPTDIDARRQLAEALWQADRRSEAVVQMEAAVRLDERHAPTIVRAGQMLLEIGDLGRSFQRAEQGIGLDATLADAWALRGRLFHRHGELQRSLADLQQALHYAPRNEDILFEVAQVQSQIGHPQRCLTTLHHLLDRCTPGDEPQRALWLQGLAYQQVERPQDALESLMAATYRGPPHADLFHALAQVELTLGMHAASEVSARKALALDSQHVASRTLLTRLHSDQVPKEDKAYLR